MSEFTNKRCVVTGAASGIGQAVAHRLIGEGARVVGLDRNEPSVGVSAHIKVELADPESIDAALAELDGEFDALVNVAGVPGTAPADVVFAVNALAVRHLTEAMLPRLNPGGSVVIVSSIAGLGWPARLDTVKEVLATESFAEGAAWFAANPQEGNAYNFAKEVTTVYVLTKALALNEKGLRINAVLPGPVETPILADFEQTMGKDTLDGVKALLGRHAVPDDIAGAIRFLLSDDARWINGLPLIADRGIAASIASGLIPAPEI
ncbi:coniferyl-alcohol dehydrogenase [Streptomyces sp. ME19-01-6]|uniref:coniferyl-alcohol dehydrogenase n=1 Tax=Streptomyces sp. ME19-01-6 TaxID=3028686 RepID=UPI0029A2B353|nr:coniferyl-alcohol dehydrogenase [Streptomyces sp. ME19-01-6]MDX3225022.1 coniferyl-alcohol dehydrogenase [Streptomyces sp. ME19-01-6]